MSIPKYAHSWYNLLPDYLNKMRESISAYCAKIGADPLLVQGAGGNISWKEDDTLWIKSSGTWLSEAKDRNIFSSLDLPHLQNSITSGNFSTTPKLKCDTASRVSIETMLHALMPQTVVLHLHAVEPLAHLVQLDFEEKITKLLNNKTICWTTTNYHKPGAALAQAANDALKEKPGAEVIFLKNHGIVIGGANLEIVDDILCQLTALLATPPRSFDTNKLPICSINLANNICYLPIADSAIHQLAIDDYFFNLLPRNWPLYPDHVVFLGSSPACLDSIDEINANYAHSHKDNCPELIFVRGTGVFVQSEFSLTKQAQLRCYYDVLSRQVRPELINPLNQEQIAELLNWDAEHYRMNIAKK